MLLEVGYPNQNTGSVKDTSMPISRRNGMVFSTKDYSGQLLQPQFNNNFIILWDRSSNWMKKPTNG